MDNIAGTINLGEFQKMNDVIKKASNGVKDHGSRATFFL